MNLPIAIHFNGETYDSAEVRELTAGDIARVKKIGEGGDVYSAFLAFAVAGCEKIGDTDSTEEIKVILKNAPFETVYKIAVLSMAKTHGLTKVDGKYKCPSCGNISDHTEDYADDIESLDGETTDEEEIYFTLNKPVVIKNSKTGEVIETVNSLGMKFPTMDVLIKAYRRYPDDESKLIFEAYKNSLTKINDQPIDDKWRGSFGDLVFQKMDVRSINSVTKEISKYDFGNVDCVCMKCKNRWRNQIDLTNFFDLGTD